MRKLPVAWALSGLVAGFAGLATAHLVSQLMNLRLDPVDAVAEAVRDVVPGAVANWARESLGTDSKGVTVLAIMVLLAAAFAVIGVLARRSWVVPVIGLGAVTVIGAVATLAATGATAVWLLPLAVGFAVMTIGLRLLADRLRQLDELEETDTYGEAWHQRRRQFLLVVGAVVGVAGVTALLGRFAGRGREEVERNRATGIRSVTRPSVPEGAALGVAGVAPWMTPVDDFYLIDTAFVKPAIPYSDWRLRIHGMVENEIELSFDDLAARELTEDWITLNCVSNEVGGTLVGNAWFSGVRLAPLLAEAGILPGADAVKQTSSDGWTCGTPIGALTDDRNAMLAIAMNGEPLTIEHGFPVRVVVPGLYGYVSATKWVVDMEVTTFDDFSAYWTDRGWGEMGPVKIASRVDVPALGEEVPAGRTVIAGSAWHQHTGVSGVQVSVDGGPWTDCDLGTTPSVDTWVQWRVEVDRDEGEHTARVRALDADGEPQTAVVRDVLPDGATGLDEVTFTSTPADT